MGWDVRIAKVPIVPAAILFDLPVGGNPKIRPTADCGYRAAAAADQRPGAGRLDRRRRRRDRRQDRAARADR